jgi:hypothetical protein
LSVELLGVGMVFEVAGFLTGVAGIGLGFLYLYMRDSTAVFSGIYGHANRKQRA